MKRDINFVQFESTDGKAIGEISLELHRTLAEIGECAEYSPNGKLLPFYEGAIEFTVTLDDGTTTVLGGTLALWYPRKHVKEAVDAARKAREEAARKAREAELQKKRAELLKAFSDEQIQALAALGMLKLEGE